MTAARGNPNWRKGGPSPNPTGKAKAEPAPAVQRVDGWINALTGVGTVTKDNRVSTTFCPDVVDYQTALDLWRGDDLAAKVVETYPSEMLRQGFCVKIGGKRKAPLPKPPTGASPEAMEKAAALKQAKNAPPAGPGGPPKAQRADADPPAPEDAEQELDPAEGYPDDPANEDAEQQGEDEDAAKELQEEIEALWEELDVEGAFWQALCYERALGGGAVLIGAYDGQAMDMPLDYERITRLDYVTALEPDELCPLYYYDDPRAPKFGQPSHYQLNPISTGNSKDGAGALKNALDNVIHESRLVVFGGIRVSRRIYTRGGWGDSVFTRIIRVLRDFNMTWSAAAILMSDFSVSVMKIKNLAEMIANDKSGKFRNRIEAIQLCQSILGMKLVDADGEDYERKTTSIAGMSDMLVQFSERYSAAADMPRTMLFGTSPGGLNATGDSDIRGFYDKTKALQRRKLRPAFEKLAKCTFPALKQKEPEQWSIYFNPLWQESAKEQAETRKIIADTDIAYIGAGVVTPEEVGMSRWGGDEYSPEMHVDFSAAAMEEREAARAAQDELDRAAMAEATAEGPDMVEEAGGPPVAKQDAFDPDQPRDETGKWTANGGASSRTPEAKAARSAKNRELANKRGKEVGDTTTRLRGGQRVSEFDRVFAASYPRGATAQEQEERRKERARLGEITDEDRAFGQQRGLDAAKNEFETLERDAAEIDRVFEEIEKRGIEGPAVKALNAYKLTAGKVGKELDGAARETIEKVTEYNAAAREAFRAFESLQYSGDHEGYVSEEVMEEIAGLEEMVSAVRISDEVGSVLGDLAKGARQLSHIGNGTVPRDGELDRVAEDVYTDIDGDNDTAEAPEDNRPFRERFAAYRASVDVLAEKLAPVEAAQKPLAAKFKASYKELDKASDGAIAEVDAFEAADETESKALDFERDARDITMAGFDEGSGDPKEVGKAVRSTSKSVAKLQKALAKIQTAVDTMKEPEPEPDDEEGDEDTGEDDLEEESAE